MPRGKALDREKLYRLAKEGKSAQAVMKELGIKNKMTLKSALADIMMDKDEVIQLAGMSGRTTGSRKLTKVGIIIPKAQLAPKFKTGDEFSLEIDGESIILKKV